MFIATASLHDEDRKPDVTMAKPGGLRPVAAILDSWWQQQAGIGASFNAAAGIAAEKEHDRASSLPRA